MRTTSMALATCGVLLAAVLATRLVAEEKPAAGAKTVSQEALVELGRRLFMDPSASRLGRHSCAECHDPERGFTDPRPRSTDDGGATQRHSQPLTDLAGAGFHWDGEFPTVRDLVVARLAPPAEAVEAQRKRVLARVAAAKEAGFDGDPELPEVPYYVGGTRTPSSVADRLGEDGRYAEAFAAAFGSPTPTTEGLCDAVDAYCASIRTTSSAFDRFRSGDDAAISASAKRGLLLFEGKAGCASCHLAGLDVGRRAPMTDGQFHDTGVAYRAEDSFVAAVGIRKKRRPADRTAAAPKPDLGLMGQTFLPADARKFKTPSLRDVAKRAPYMHDASFETLTDVVRYYAKGGTPHDGLDPAVHPLSLTDAEVADVVAFLESLTGDGRAGLGFASPARKPLRARFLDLEGKPLADFTVTAEPFGDRLLGDAPDRKALVQKTDWKGWATIERPLSTHMVLTSDTHWIGAPLPVPDTCATRTIIAAPRRTVAVRVRRRSSHPDFPDTVSITTTGWEGSELLKLRRGHALSADEVLYTGQGVLYGETRSCTVHVGKHFEITTDVPLGGGPIAPIFLE